MFTETADYESIGEDSTDENMLATVTIVKVDIYVSTVQYIAVFSVVFVQCVSYIYTLTERVND